MSNPNPVEGAWPIEVKFERNAWQIYNNGWLLGGDFASKEAAEQWMAHFRSPKAALSAAPAPQPATNDEWLESLVARLGNEFIDQKKDFGVDLSRIRGVLAFYGVVAPAPARDGVREVAQSTKEYAEQCARDLLTRLFNEHYGSGEAKWFRHALRRNLEPMLVKELLLFGQFMAAKEQADGQ